MWILNFLPDWIFHALFVIGVIGYAATFLIRFLPSFVYVYKLPIQLISVGLMAISLYMIGAIAEREAWEARVKEMEEKVKISEEKSKEENIKIVTEVVTKTKVIKEKAKERVAYIDREIVKYDTKFLPGGDCEIPKEFINVINQAADPTK